MVVGGNNGAVVSCAGEDAGEERTSMLGQEGIF